MNIRPFHLLMGAAVVATLLAIAAWFNASAALDTQRTRVVTGLLDPAAALLTENQTLLNELKVEPFIEKDVGSLVGYLAKIRRDGLPKHAAMKKRLERLADNHLVIVTLLTAYAPHARTPGLAGAEDKFRKDAALWRDRWNTTMELFMAGGNMPETEMPVPAALLDALKVEQTAAR